MLRIIIFSILFAIPLLGYTPGKWSHKDVYIFQKNSNGPIKEIVRNSEGQVIYVAEYKYTEEGKLELETYVNKEGKADGKTLFRYTDGKISSEEVYNERGDLIEKKSFLYKGPHVKKVTIKTEDDHSVTTFNLETDPEGNIIAGESRNPATKDTDSFRFYLDPKKPNVQIQKMTDDKKRTLGEIVFKYNSKSQLVEREFMQGEFKRIHKLKYRSDGQLESHSFHVKQGDNWILEKTHVLVYEETNKSKVSKKD